MIDLHLHLLPAIDDGAPSADVSRAMLERARALGFRTLVATPHLPGPLRPTYADRIAEALAEVRALAADLGLDVLLGFEAALTHDLAARLAGGEPVTLAGSRAVLVDLPFSGWPTFADETLFAVQTAGFRPVLAHPERYATIQREPARALRLAERGVVLQVTVGSLAGLFGKETQRVAEGLVQRGAVQVVATDAHSAGGRLTAVPDGLARLRVLVGEERFAWLTDGAPRALLDGNPLPEVVVAPPEERRLGWVAAVRRLTRRDAT